MQFVILFSFMSRFKAFNSHPKTIFYVFWCGNQLTFDCCCFFFLCSLSHNYKNKNSIFFFKKKDAYKEKKKIFLHARDTCDNSLKEIPWTNCVTLHMQGGIERARSKIFWNNKLVNLPKRDISYKNLLYFHKKLNSNVLDFSFGCNLEILFQLLLKFSP